MRKIDSWIEHSNMKCSTGILKLIDKYFCGPEVLDYGAGHGQYSNYLSLKGYKPLAMDIENYLTYNLPFKKIISNSALPFVDNYFQNALLLMVLEHVEDDKKLLYEMNRVIRDTIILWLPNEDNTNLHKYNLTFKHYKDKGHFREYNIKNVKELVEAAGFNILYLEEVGEIDPLLIGEFIRNKLFKYLLINILRFFRKVGMIKRALYFSDIYCVAKKNLDLMTG